jgi:hypothetical protein
MRPRRPSPGSSFAAGELKLPKLALDVLAAQPQIDKNPYVFAGSLHGRRKSGDRWAPACFNGFSQHKHELGEKLPDDIARWTLHDLRRTARS